MADPRNLSFSTTFNQPKIIINSSQPVSIAAFSSGVILTVPSGSPTKPLPPRLAIEKSGSFYPMFGGSNNSTIIGSDITFIASYDSSNRLIVQATSNEAVTVTLTIHYRIYKDARNA
jgi:hypothetical protein